MGVVVQSDSKIVVAGNYQANLSFLRVWRSSATTRTGVLIPRLEALES